MNGHPKRFFDKLSRLLSAWKELAPESRFGEMSLSEFETAVAPSVRTREELADLSLQIRGLIASRDAATSACRPIRARVVAGVLAHPDHGPDSAFYRALGYIPKSERGTGLRRKQQAAESEKERVGGIGEGDPVEDGSAGEVLPGAQTLSYPAAP